jgi:hypothetical protein
MNSSSSSSSWLHQGRVLLLLQVVLLLLLLLLSAGAVGVWLMPPRQQQQQRVVLLRLGCWIVSNCSGIMGLLRTDLSACLTRDVAATAAAVGEAGELVLATPAAEAAVLLVLLLSR